MWPNMLNYFVGASKDSIQECYAAIRMSLLINKESIIYGFFAAHDKQNDLAKNYTSQQVPPNTPNEIRVATHNELS